MVMASSRHVPTVGLVLNSICTQSLMNESISIEIHVQTEEEPIIY